jgi:hypothetical protein
MLDKAQAYETRLSGLKVDARRLFPVEIKGFPAATQSLIQSYREKPRSDLLDEELSKKSQR